jgi:hypothetical protein
MRSVVTRAFRSLALLQAVTLLAAAPAPASAEPSLDGTWSGIMTSRHDDYWQVEDWLCFNGCTDEGLAHLKDLLADPKNDPVPAMALIGQTWGFMRASFRPKVIGKGVEIFDTIDDSNDPTLNCQPYGFAREVVNALPIKIRADGKNLVIDYEEWTQTRTIYLDGREHPKHPKPTPLGHSIGHYEGGVLVVDTVGLSPDIFYPQYAGGGYSERAHARERYTVLENPKRLRLDLWLEDPTMLNTPFEVHKVWLYKPDLKLVHDSCKDYPTKP